MKKILTLFTVVGLMVFSSCTGPEGPPGVPGRDGQDGLISEVFELQHVNFSVAGTNRYEIYQKLNPKIYASDVVLIYRLSDVIPGSNTPVWQSIPRTLYLNEGELDYDFDFSQEDFTIYAGGNYPLSSTPGYLNDETFRIVIVPGSFSKAINKNNYNDVISALNIKESEVKKIQF